MVKKLKRAAKMKVLERLVALGKEKGRITYEEVNNILPDDMFSSEEIDEVMEVLDKEDITLIDQKKEEYVLPHPPRFKKAVTKEEGVSPRPAQVDAPVKMYLKQMGQLPLLTREQEITLAVRIKEAEDLFRKNVLWTTIARTFVIDVLEDALRARVVSAENLRFGVSLHRGKQQGTGLERSELLAYLAAVQLGAVEVEHHLVDLAGALGVADSRLTCTLCLGVAAVFQRAGLGRPEIDPQHAFGGIGGKRFGVVLLEPPDARSHAYLSG